MVFWQILGRWIRCIDYDLGVTSETITQRVARVLGKGYAFGKFLFPHDALQTERTGRTFATEVREALAEAGYNNAVAIVPRTTDLWVGINAVRSLLPCMEFRLPQCARGVEGLEAYHKKSQTASGLTVDEPVHDWSSHDADGVRVFAEANVAGMIKTGHSINQRLDDESWFGPRKRARVISGFRGRVNHDAT